MALGRGSVRATGRDVDRHLVRPSREPAKGTAGEDVLQDGVTELRETLAKTRRDDNEKTYAILLFGRNAFGHGGTRPIL